jgi:hypothetical protein
MDVSREAPMAKRLHLLPTAQSTAGLLTPLSYSSHLSGTASVPPMSYGAALDATPNLDSSRVTIPRLAVANAMPTNNQLAPLNLPVNRAMSSVYPTTTTASWSQPKTPVSAVPSNLYPLSLPNLAEASRPYSNAQSEHTSPVGYGTSTPILPGLSPSHFLTNRASPYRPVRNVNTLVIPPPSAALQNHVRNIDLDQIHYQPLSKSNTEPRPGPIPRYYPDGWQGSNANTPIQQKWPHRF